MRPFLLATIATLALLSTPALAQEAAEGGDTPISTIPAGGRQEVRISRLEQEIRTLHGTIEQLQYSNQKLAVDLKKLSDDADYRLRAMEEKQAAASVIPAPAPIAAPVPAAPTTAEAAQYEPAKKPDAKPAPATAAAPTGNDFPDANAHYSSAFKLLNEKKYSEAATSFDGFVKKYPADPLTANAYYWLGESYYARADYTRAAESFRKGFEVGPSGQKAPDNLYKLAKSLEQVKRTNEACVVLGQIIKKYPDAAPRTVKLAEDERLAMQCK